MTTTTASAPVATDVQQAAAKRVEQFVQVRDRLKQMDEAHEQARKPLLEVKSLLEGWLQQFLQQAGATSVKTESGTFYQTVRYSSSLADAEAFMRFVTENKMFDLLDRRANTTAVRAYVTEHSVLPPGVNLSELHTIGVRRGADKST